MDAPAADPLSPAPGPARHRSAALLVVLLVLGVGVASMPGEQYAGDPLAVRLATWSLLTRGRLDVPEERVEGERGQYFVQNPSTGLWYSKYGLLNTLGYVPALALERALEGRLEAVNNSRRRTLLLNLDNLALSAALALLLYALAACYTERAHLAALFVVSSLYATFGWNYLRAQTTELLQWTLYVAFFLLLVRTWRSRGAAPPLLAAQGVLLLLALTKLVYVMLMPLLAAVALLAPLQDEEGRLPPAGRWAAGLAGLLRGRIPLVLAVFGPLAFTAAVVLGLNQVKFGGLLVTGYTQWTREADLFRGDLLAGVLGFLFHPQRSIFLYDPLLLLALPALPAFFRRRPVEALAAWLPLAAFLLLHAQTTNWAGHWAYGPRYLLPVLSAAVLPALDAFRWLEDRRGTLQGRVLAGLALVLLAASIWMGGQVNRLGFFTYYEVEAAVKGLPAPRALAQLERTPFGVLNRQLADYRRTDRFPPFLKTASQELSSDQTAFLARAVRDRVRTNSWWSP